MGIDWYFYVEDKKGREFVLDNARLGWEFEKMGWRVKWKWKDLISVDIIKDWLGITDEEVEAVTWRLIPDEEIVFELKNGKKIIIDREMMKIVPRVQYYLPVIRVREVNYFRESYTGEILFDFCKEDRKFFDYDGYIWSEEKVKQLISVAQERARQSEILRRKVEKLVPKLENLLKITGNKLIDISY